jgi:hypothetical protein
LLVHIFKDRVDLLGQLSDLVCSVLFHGAKA